MPKLNIIEINLRIEARLRELKLDRAQRERAQKTASKVEARVDELRTELIHTREALQRHRAALKEVREDLHIAELEAEIERLREQLGEVPPGLLQPEDRADDVQVARFEARLDSLAGLIEEGVATRDRLLDRLDRLRERDADAQRAVDEAIREIDDDRQTLERMRKRRQRIKERMDRPSVHFAYAEFDCHNGQDLPKAAEPAVKDWCQRIGEPLRRRFGAVHINSAYRPAAYNASVGGEQNSIHIYDFAGRNFRAVAADISCERGTPEQWYAFTGGKADGRGIYATFHHADTRGRIGWADATWTG